MAEVTEQEYRAKERERNRYQQEKKNCEKKIATIEDEIKELDRAIERMTQVYEEFKHEVKEMDELIEEKREFTGNQQTRLIGVEGGALVWEAKNCQSHAVNNALDQLEWLRNEKRTQRNEQYGILGKIKSSLSSLWTWLNTNYFNN